MTRTRSAHAAVLLTGALLLTACGTEPGASHRAGPPPDAGDGIACGPEPSDVPTTPVTAVTPGAGDTAPPPGDTWGLKEDGATVTVLDASAGCIAFEVTNFAAEPFTYTIGFDLRAESGAGVEYLEQTVPSVEPGGTIRRTVPLGGYPEDAWRPDHALIHRVRSVPDAEAAIPAGPCPPSGVHAYADEGDAAMGLRALGLHLVNCGTETVRLDGYPELEILDERHRPADAVVLHGGSAIAAGTGADGRPRPLDLKPGEHARAVLTWRNTVDLGSGALHAPYVRMVAAPGAAPLMLIVELDLGTTGRAGVGPWEPAEPTEHGTP